MLTLRRSFGYTITELVIVMAMVAVLAVASIAFFGSATRANHDSRKHTAISQAQLALERWAEDHQGSYLDPGTGHVVRVTVLYGDPPSCVPRVCYLASDVKDPDTGARYTDSQIQIFDRFHGGSGLGYCVKVEFGDDWYGATDDNKDQRILADPGSCR